MIEKMGNVIAFAAWLFCSGCGSSSHLAPIPSVSSARSSARGSARSSALPVREGAPSPKTPDYELGADVEARRAEATRELGARTDLELVEGTFIIAAPGGRAALSGAPAVARRALAAYFNGRFSERPQRAISVYLFPNAPPYDAYCKKRWAAACESPYGFYLNDERRIVMNVGLGIGTLTHELVHPLVAVDFPSAPDWINEGIASLFEQFYFSGPGEIHGSKNWRHSRLASALRSKKERTLATLPALFQLSDPEFRGEHEALNYATARYFCQWLDKQGALWPFYQRWREQFATDPSGEQSFRQILGKTPNDANAEWTAWVLSL